MPLVVLILGFFIGSVLDWLADASLVFAQERPAEVKANWRGPVLVRRALTQPQSEDRPHLIFEALTATVLVLLYLRYGLSWASLGLMALGCLFLLIAVTDFRYRLVLNVITYPATLIAILIHIFVLGDSPVSIALGMLLAFGMFFLTALIKPGALGGGDTKLAVFLGACFGFPQILWVLIAGAIASAVIIIWLLVVKQATFETTLPYAPFLCFGAVVLLILNPAFTLGGV
ncbi:MAG: prepilin peptidase [Anaerolineae bacterium]|nr:prepilin peptidase [Anaerolineae bacterium]